MKTNSNNNVRINKVVNAAKKEVREMTKSPLYYCHTLNKSVKKNTAVDGCVLESVKALYKIVCEYDARGFSYSVLPQDTNGRICKMRPATSKTFKGGDLIETYAGVYEFVPVSMTFAGILDAVGSYMTFRKLVEGDLQSDKSKKLTQAQLIRAYRAHEITADEFLAAVNA